MESSRTSMLRMAGNNERRCIIRESLGLYGSIVIAVSYHIPGRLDQQQVLDILQPAVSACQKRHALLNGIAFRGTDTERPLLARAKSNGATSMPRITIWTEQEKAELELLSESASHSCLRDLDDDLPWRINALLRSDEDDSNETRILVAFVASHGLADGRSGILFHHSLLGILNRKHSDISAELQLPKAMEDCGKFSISLGFLLKHVLNEYLPSMITRLLGLGGQAGTDQIWRGSASRPAQNGQPRTSVEVLTLSGELVSTVLQTCRTQHARLTGVLNYVLSRALSHTLHQHGQDFTRFIAATAMDLRGALSTANEDLIQSIGVYSAVNDEIIATSADDRQFDWDAVRTTTEELSRASKTLSDQTVGLLKYLSNYKQWLVNKSLKQSDGSFGMSNLGVFDGTAQGDEIKAERIFFAQSGDITGEPFNVNVASVKNGPLSIVFTWWPGVLGVTDEAAFMHDLGEEVTRLFIDLSRATGSDNGPPRAEE